MQTKRFSALLCLIAFAWSLCTQTHGADRHGSDLMPASTIGYAELKKPGLMIDSLLNHPYRARLEQLDAWKKGMESPQVAQAQIGLKFVEFLLGMEWRKVLETIAGEELAIGFDLHTHGLILVAQASEPAPLRELWEKLLKLARDDARRKKQPDPISERQYRGTTVYEANGIVLAIVERQLLVANQSELAHRAIDLAIDGKTQAGELIPTLTASDVFTQATRESNTSASKTGLWGFANIKAIRDQGIAPQVYGGKSENVVAEMLVGGILDTLKEAPYVALNFWLNDQSARLAFQVPFSAAWVTEPRQHFFGPDAKGVAPRLIAVPETVLSLRFHRDLGRMWRRGDELLTQRGSEELAKASAGISTLFGGKDFGEEVLSLLQPEVQFIATRAQPEPDYPTPANRLPAFALVMEMRDPAMTRRELRRTFQSVIGFLNIVGAMNAQPQLELDVEKFEQGELITSVYLPDSSQDKDGTARINFNFSPTAGFAGSRFVLSSSRTLARQIMTAPTVAQGDPMQIINTVMDVHGSVVQSLLRDNQEQLISQRMLEEGKSRKEAEEQIKTILDLVGFIRDFKLALSQGDKNLTFEAVLRVAE